MMEHWEHSIVRGNKNGDDGYTVFQTILHRRGEDPVRLACRRDGRMAACSRIEVSTTEAFLEERHDLPVHRDRKAIPKDERPAWKFEDLPD